LVVLGDIFPIIDQLQFQDVGDDDLDFWFFDIVRFLVISDRAGNVRDILTDSIPESLARFFASAADPFLPFPLSFSAGDEAVAPSGLDFLVC
jgi:hypothetical protein